MSHQSLTAALRFKRLDVVVRAPARHGFVDLTDELCLAIGESDVSEGCVVAFCTHTTSTLMINEWEDGALEDLRVRLRELVPDNRYYRHDDLSSRTQNLQEGAEPANGPAHVAAMLMGGTSHVIPVASGKPVLGRWQRLFMIEFDEPKDRTIVLFVFGA